MASAVDDPVVNRLELGDVETRKANTLMRDILRLANAPADQPASERDSALQHIRASIDYLEYIATERCDTVMEMNAKQTTEYGELEREIGAQLETARSDIAEAKAQLKDARRLRRNKQEYDTLAEEIALHPARATSQREAEAAEAQLAILAGEKEKLKGEMARRSKQFFLLVHSARELRRALEGEAAAAAASQDEQEQNCGNNGSSEPMVTTS